jgi:hypothetical protein
MLLTDLEAAGEVVEPGELTAVEGGETAAGVALTSSPLIPRTCHEKGRKPRETCGACSEQGNNEEAVLV